MVAVLEGGEQTAVRGLLLWALEVRQTSGHAEVHEHPPAPVESCEEVLAGATGEPKGVTLQGALQRVSGDVAQYLFVAHPYGPYLLMQGGRVHISLEGLHVGEVRQRSSLQHHLL